MSSLKIPGVDYAWQHPDPAKLAASGVKFVMRYLSNDVTKNLTATELAALRKHGLGVGVAWESTAGRALGGRSAGVQDAKAAQVQLARLGLDVPVYFAVDFDALDAQKPAIAEYLRGAASVLGPDKVGVYGGYYVVKYMAEHKAARWFWQTYAWSGGKVHPATHIYQYRNGFKGSYGGTVDLDSGTDAPGGFGVAGMPAPPTRVALRTRLARALGGGRAADQALIDIANWDGTKGTPTPADSARFKNLRKLGGLGANSARKVIYALRGALRKGG